MFKVTTRYQVNKLNKKYIIVNKTKLLANKVVKRPVGAQMGPISLGHPLRLNKAVEERLLANWEGLHQAI